MGNEENSVTNLDAPVLIVDDNPQYTQVLKRILQKGLGYSDVTTADSPQQAFDLINQQPQRFKLLFVDYHFPGGESGAILLERLSRASLLMDKVAFLVTADPTADNLKQAMKFGAKGVVAKPFDRDDLKKQLEKAQRSIAVDQGEGF